MNKTRKHKRVAVVAMVLGTLITGYVLSQWNHYGENESPGIMLSMGLFFALDGLAIYLLASMKD